MIKNIKLITYKYKEYNDKKDIIKQGKIDCGVISISDAKSLLELIGYKELIQIRDHLIVYVNDKTELAVQFINDKYIYIEIEEKSNYVSRKYDSIEEMIDNLKQYNIPIKSDNYFVKNEYLDKK